MANNNMNYVVEIMNSGVKIMNYMLKLMNFWSINMVSVATVMCILLAVCI